MHGTLYTSMIPSALQKFRAAALNPLCLLKYCLNRPHTTVSTVVLVGSSSVCNAHCGDSDYKMMLKWT